MLAFLQELAYCCGWACIGITTVLALFFLASHKYDKSIVSSLLSILVVASLGAVAGLLFYLARS